MDKLVEIQGLDVRFSTYEGDVRAVDNVDLDIYAQETLGLVGETGCGKTVTALSLLGRRRLQTHRGAQRRLDEPHFPGLLSCGW